MLTEQPTIDDGSILEPRQQLAAGPYVGVPIAAGKLCEDVKEF